MNFMSIYANIYNWTSLISKIFLIYLTVGWEIKNSDLLLKAPFKLKNKN
jgi:hypothetical protein